MYDLLPSRTPSLICDPQAIPLSRNLTRQFSSRLNAPQLRWPQSDRARHSLPSDTLSASHPDLATAHAAVCVARAPPVFPLVMPFHWGDFAGRSLAATRMRIFLVSGELTLPLAGARVNRWISKSDTTAWKLGLQVTSV